MTTALWIIAVCAIIRTVLVGAIMLGALLSINKEDDNGQYTDRTRE